MPAAPNLFSYRLLWLSVGLVLIVLSGSASLVNSGNANGQIVLKPGEIGPDAAFVRGYLAARGDTESNPEEFYVGRHDLNNDEQLELFIVFYEPGYCGTAGCEMMIFEKIDGSWNAFAGMYVHGPSYGHRDEIFLETKDEGAPYLTVYGYHLGMRWDGTSYRGFCIGRECERPEWRR